MNLDVTKRQDMKQKKHTQSQHNQCEMERVFIQSQNVTVLISLHFFCCIRACVRAYCLLIPFNSVEYLFDNKEQQR